MLTTAMIASVISGKSFAEDSVSGTWYIQSMEDGGEIFNAQDLSVIGMDVTMVLNEDNSVNMDYSGTTFDGQWKYENGKGSVIINDDPADFHIDDEGNLIFEQDDMKMIFSTVKAETEKFEITDVDRNVDIKDFDGVWEADVISVSGNIMPIKLLGQEIRITIKDGLIIYKESDTINYDDYDETEGSTEEDEKYFEEHCELIDGALTVDNKKLGHSLNLKLHTDGTMTDGYEDAAEYLSGETEAENSMEYLPSYIHFTKIPSK